MKRKLNTALGFYVPSFLRMRVGTKLSLENLNALHDDLAESVYLHLNTFKGIALEMFGAQILQSPHPG